MTEGTTPPPASIRTEEWVNALGSLQEAPAEGDLGLRIDGPRSPRSNAARDVAREERAAANLTFVVDTSGSMDIRERLGLVKSVFVAEQHRRQTRHCPDHSAGAASGLN